MKLNLSSQIVLNKIPEKYYHPHSAVEASELTRREKIPTSIFSKADDGARYIADAIEKEIRRKQDVGEK